MVKEEDDEEEEIKIRAGLKLCEVGSVWRSSLCFANVVTRIPQKAKTLPLDVLDTFHSNVHLTSLKTTR